MTTLSIRLRGTAATLLAIVLTTLLGNMGTAPAQERDSLPTIEAGDYRISGPYVYKNLAVYLLHGREMIPDQTFLTLQEAMEQNKVKVYETGTVGELMIENLSKDEDVFIQSGDIVKGGKQDRTISYDLVLEPNSGKVPLKSFCVERSRWSQRSNEAVQTFSASTNQLAHKDLKLAAKYKRNQSEVWSKVQETQEALSENIGKKVTDNESASSLQLSLENGDVQKSADEYVENLIRIIEEHDDVIGYAFSINGEFNSADAYASIGLFAKLWPRLLKAAAVEAIAEMGTTEQPAPAPTVDEVTRSMQEAEAGSASAETVSGRVQMITVEEGKNLLFETRDNRNSGTWIHRNYIAK